MDARQLCRFHRLALMTTARLPDAMSATARSLTHSLRRTNVGYRLYLRFRHGSWGPWKPVIPQAPWHNAVLQTRSEWEAAFDQVRRLRLPPHQTGSKNWDSLAALSCILNATGRQSAILDAGGEWYSVILPWLWLCGYRNLTSINLGSAEVPASVRGSIRYETGDLTATRFGPESFDAVTCLSVVEHGVSLEAYFREAARILKPGGVLVTSADYWAEPVDTNGRQAFGAPVRIFTKDEITAAIDLAAQFGLRPTGELDLRCDERAVRWDEQDLEYTFVIFTLRKEGA